MYFPLRKLQMLFLNDLLSLVLIGVGLFISLNVLSTVFFDQVSSQMHSINIFLLYRVFVLEILIALFD